MTTDDLQIVIPMSGFGERFRRAGYTVPKPLIEVDGKPIIAHVVDLFPGSRDVTFVCNRDHLAEARFGLESLLRGLAPEARVVAIEPHRLGPIHAVEQAMPQLDRDRPVVVNYCDFTCDWDWRDFVRFVDETACAGAIPCYRGFHPHSLGSTFYAYVREQGRWATAIQEKQPFTDTPLDEYASSGTYYFSSAGLMAEAFAETRRLDLRVGGEFYVSMAYRPLFERGLPVAVYELAHFMQWGTPEDLEEYLNWSDLFRALVDGRHEPGEQAGAVLVPAAGLGSRFAREGIETPKPLLPVSGRPMLVQALRDLPRAPRQRVVLRRDLPGLADVERTLAEQAPDCDVVLLDALTDGQARTCLLGLEGLDPEAPLTIGACDNGLLYSAARFAEQMADAAVDVLVWSARGHPNARRRPEHFGWIDADEAGRIRGVSVKQPLADPRTDPIVVGAFTFRRAGDFRRAAERMIARDARVNGELYVDTCINDAIALGLACRLMPVDHYPGWGTPDDWRTFDYWQDCFHHWRSHPYTLEADARVLPAARSALARRSAPRPAPRPEPRGTPAAQETSR